MSGCSVIGVLDLALNIIMWTIFLLLIIPPSKHVGSMEMKLQTFLIPNGSSETRSWVPGKDSGKERQKESQKSS
jgi:hypothetical protein